MVSRVSVWLAGALWARSSADRLVRWGAVFGILGDLKLGDLVEEWRLLRRGRCELGVRCEDVGQRLPGGLSIAFSGGARSLTTQLAGGLEYICEVSATCQYPYAGCR